MLHTKLYDWDRNKIYSVSLQLPINIVGDLKKTIGSYLTAEIFLGEYMECVKGNNWSKEIFVSVKFIQFMLVSLWNVYKLIYISLQNHLTL